MGKQLARLTHEDETYSIVDFENSIAVFGPSSSSLTDPRQAAAVFRSYAWGSTLEDLDTCEMAETVAAVRGADYVLDDIRDSSRDTVTLLDNLEALSVDVPLLGEITALSVIIEIFPEAEGAVGAIRALEAEFDAVKSHANTLGDMMGQIEDADPSSGSSSEMDAVFSNAVSAARGIEAKFRSAKDKVALARNIARGLKTALLQASDNRSFGETFAEYAVVLGDFETELSWIADGLESFEGDADDLADHFETVIDTADQSHEEFVSRWLQNPPVQQWPARP